MASLNTWRTVRRKRGIHIRCAALKAQATTMTLVFQREALQSNTEGPDYWSHVSARIHCATPRPAQLNVRSAVIGALALCTGAEPH